MQRLADFYTNLSPESLHCRFLGYARGVTGSAARSFCTLDHMHDEGFVALDETVYGGNAILGHVCLVRVAPGRAELGIAVADASQGEGIGRRLFETALVWARDRGFETIVASCFADNWRVLALLRSAPNSAAISTAASGVVDVVIPMRGRIQRESSRPPYPNLRRPASVKPLRVAWRRTPPPERVAGD